MAEYIKKQAVIDEIDEDIQVFSECEYALSFIRRWIESLPPADVRPVVRGKWTLLQDGSGICSECKALQKHIWDYDHWQNFCGCCGADMRGGDADGGKH